MDISTSVTLHFELDEGAQIKARSDDIIGLSLSGYPDEHLALELGKIVIRTARRRLAEKLLDVGSDQVAA